MFLFSELVPYLKEQIGFYLGWSLPAVSRPGRPCLPDEDVLWRYLPRDTFDGNRCSILTPIVGINIKANLESVLPENGSGSRAFIPR